MGATLFEKAPAKVNLTLRVRGRRADGYHELESLVAFADVGDTLTLSDVDKDGLEVAGPFAGKSGPVADNLVLKALAAIRERIGGLKAGRFLLEKNVPVAAGLGGGSADAAAALRLVARANGLAIDDDRFMSAARAVGADVPVCLDPQPRVMGDLRSVLRERFGEKVHTPLVSAERSLFGRRLPGVGLADAVVRQPGLADDLISALEIRALWGRYGL